MVVIIFAILISVAVVLPQDWLLIFLSSLFFLGLMTSNKWLQFKLLRASDERQDKIVVINSLLLIILFGLVALTTDLKVPDLGQSLSKRWDDKIDSFNNVLFYSLLVFCLIIKKIASLKNDN